ncbi:hypothetical protein LTR10_019437 [Elasticomyces elasticus]|uniref:DUF7587 domain-containing protein n=1 Tax=Exophiala sideris TaxID=1016849 RepID=A0ABR0J2I4_9EURO|nr:hypothetical protein LTR10_019437 [Elasticomyces elasticus]KAK5024085.1 hypothetical protein LTS07_008819 [Exophiala sideris]KAK5029053.1 hypothetical protein LTR13_008924 [Exophiala sideris]KAK5054797.1 hypothetical protein LTR69_008704 [Exophiala sideris]KAK5178876.1 hypothetical protein LTR44_008705 [Eurotiomycetes sp. CCFEE 6388]
MEEQRLLDILNQSVAKHVWTVSDRELLAVAEKLYDMTNKDLTALFNHLYRDHLLTEGLTDGLRVTAIAAQISDLKRTIRGTDFREILAMAPTTVYHKYSSLATIIEKAAQGLGIPLQTYADRSRHSDVSPVKRPLTARSDDWADVTDEEEDSHSLAKKPRIIRTPSPIHSSPTHVRQPTQTTTSPSDATPMTTTSLSSSFVDTCSPGSYLPESNADENDYQGLDDQHFAATSTRIPPLLRITYDDTGRSAATRPRLLFRAYNPEHMLVARRYLGATNTICPPPPFSSDEFRRMASDHLYEDKTFASPFLSWTENPKRALELIKSSKTPLSMAAVDYNVLEKDLIQTFGESATPWLVPKICQRFELTDLTRIHEVNTRVAKENQKNYTGTGEFLTWGSIKCDLVGTLERAAAMKLYTTMEDMKKTSYEAGLVLSECLQDIHGIYREVMSYKLCRAFKKADCVKDSYRYDSFIRGVYREDSGDRAGDFSTDDDQEIVKSLRCEKSDGISAGRLEKLRGQPRAIPNRWISMGEEEVQCLVDTQLSETGALFGIIVDNDDSVAESEAKSTMDPTETTIQSVSTTTDGAIDYVKVETSQHESRLAKILDIPEWVPMKPLPGSRNARSRTSYRKFSAKFNALKVLQDQQATIVADDEKAALSLDQQADKRQAESQPFIDASVRRRCCAYTDLRDDNNAEAQTSLFTVAGSAESADVQPTHPPSDSIPQKNISHGADQPSKTATTNGPTIDTLHDIQEDVDEELQIIGTATIHQRRTVRTRTHTVLTVRSRSLSAAAAGLKH